MPGMYLSNDYDVAGFVVGVVEQDKMLDGKNIANGDAIIGIASSGPHANGFSLIRQILSQQRASQSILEQLTKPTKIYTNTILSLLEKISVNALAHITGGGLFDNIERVLTNNQSAHIYSNNWQMPDIFKWLQTKGKISYEEMLKVFNCGIGMVVIAKPQNSQKIIQILKDIGEQAYVIGEILAKEKKQSIVIK